MQRDEIHVLSGWRSLMGPLGALLLLWGCSPAVVELPRSSVIYTDGVTVSGQGEASAPPDIARISIGVEVRSPTVEAATTEATARMTRLQGALQAFKLEPRDVQTTSYSVNYETDNLPLPPPPPPPPPPGKVGGTFSTPPSPPAAQGFYHVSNLLEITVRHLDQLGAILATATREGGNSIAGINFEIDDPTKLNAVARQKAVADARARADALAQLSGVKLGRVLSINESGGGAQPFYKEGAAFASAADSRVPVQSGEVKTTLQVQIVYEILKN